MIEIEGSTEKVNEEVDEQIRSVVQAQYDKRGGYNDVDSLTETISEWAWGLFASQAGGPGYEFTIFAYDGTWDDLVDSYDEERGMAWEQGKIV